MQRVLNCGKCLIRQEQLAEITKLRKENQQLLAQIQEQDRFRFSLWHLPVIGVVGAGAYLAWQAVSIANNAIHRQS